MKASPLIDQEITRILIDLAVTFETESGAQLRVESPILLFHEPAAPIKIDPHEPAASGNEIVALLRKRIKDASISLDGTLTIAFEAGPRLEIACDKRYEAWTLSTQTGELLVSMPGGEVAYWEGTPSD
jgi:hypothetical protein